MPRHRKGKKTKKRKHSRQLRHKVPRHKRLGGHRSRRLRIARRQHLPPGCACHPAAQGTPLPPQQPIAPTQPPFNPVKGPHGSQQPGESNEMDWL
jgi:hypothetical protein